MHRRQKKLPTTLELSLGFQVPARSDATAKHLAGGIFSVWYPVGWCPVRRVSYY